MGKKSYWQIGIFKKLLWCPFNRLKIKERKRIWAPPEKFCVPGQSYTWFSPIIIKDKINQVGQFDYFRWSIMKCQLIPNTVFKNEHPTFHISNGSGSYSNIYTVYNITAIYYIRYCFERTILVISIAQRQWNNILRRNKLLHHFGG